MLCAIALLSQELFACVYIGKYDSSVPAPPFYIIG